MRGYSWSTFEGIVEFTEVGRQLKTSSFSILRTCEARINQNALKGVGISVQFLKGTAKIYYGGRQRRNLEHAYQTSELDIRTDA